MSEYTIEKRKVSKTGSAYLGWQVGHGYRRESLKIDYEAWCILKNGKVIAEARNKTCAQLILEALDYMDWLGLRMGETGGDK